MDSRSDNRSILRHVLKYTGVFGGVQGFSLLASVLRNKVSALLVGAAGMGLADLYARTMDWMAGGCNLGLPFSAVKQLSELFEADDAQGVARQAAVVRHWALGAALVGLLVAEALSVPLSRFVMGGPGFEVAFATLALMVPMLTLSGCEAAILKAVRRLKGLAGAAMGTAAATLAVTAAAYGLWGLGGIVPALLLGAAAQLALHLRVSLRAVPWSRGPGWRAVWREGLPMLRLGAAYVAAGLIGSGAEVLVRVVVRHGGSVAEVGWYAAGFTLTVSYARIVFMAMDADYYPRLAGAGGQTERANQLVNRQVDVCVMLMTPFLLAFALVLPWVVRLIYTPEFLPVVPMVLLALPCMFFKAATTPVAYLALARADAPRYLLAEALYNVFLVVAVAYGFHHWQLAGAGVALTAAHVFDFALVAWLYGHYHHFRYERATLLHAGLHLILLLLGLSVFFLPLSAAVQYGSCGVCLLLSSLWSWRLWRSAA